MRIPLPQARTVAAAEEKSLFDQQFSLESPSGALLNVYRRVPPGAKRAVLLVQHGLAEHARRYARFADDMAAAGIVVYAHDHRGHGSTAAFDAPFRRFAKKNGGPKLVVDTEAVRLAAVEEHHGLPVFVLGHSMGGLVALSHALRHGRGLAGVGIWNIGVSIGLQERLAVAALKVERMLKGSDTASEIFARATTGAWAKAIVPRTSPYDWLSHDAQAVAAYAADPLCGWTPTISMAEDLVETTARAAQGLDESLLPAGLPLHLLGGGEDPATHGGAAVEALADRARLSGSRDITLRIVPGARHEVLHELEPFRTEAIEALLGWIDRVLAKA